MHNEPKAAPGEISAAQVIAHYQSLAVLTARMRVAAVRDEWDELISIESQRSQLLSIMKPMDAVVQLDIAAREIKKQWIEKIQHDDVLIRTLLLAQMDLLQLKIQSEDQGQRLRQAYGP